MIRADWRGVEQPKNGASRRSLPSAPPLAAPGALVSLSLTRHKRGVRPARFAFRVPSIFSKAAATREREIGRSRSLPHQSRTHAPPPLPPPSQPARPPSFTGLDPLANLQHAGHLSSHVEMSWHYGIPSLSVVFLLLLSFSTQSEPSQDCVFEYNPVHTADSSFGVKDLIPYLLFDYPVSVPSNLKLDPFCQELWKVHLINQNLSNLLKVSGESLTKLIQNVTNHTKFVEECNIKDSCVTFEMTNISHFLAPLPSLLVDLRDKMEHLTDNELADFRNCSIIQCEPGPFTTPVSENQGRTQPSQKTSPERSYWGLILIPLVLTLVVVWSCLCRRKFQRLPTFEEPDL